MSENELKEYIEKIGTSFEQFKASYDKKIYDLETIVARGAFPGGSGGTGTISPAQSEYGKNFVAWFRSGKGEDVLRGMAPRAEWSTQSDPDGGFLVPEQLDKQIDRLAIDSVAMRRIANVKSGLRGDYKRPFSKGGATGGWVGETETRLETSTPELALFAPPWSELYALPKVTQSLLDNTDFDVEGWLLEELLGVEIEMEGAAFITGNGVKQPKGILDYDTIANASWAWGKIGYLASGEASAFGDTDGLISLQHALKSVYRRNSTFLMNDATLEHVRKFKDGDGNYIWRPGLESGAAGTLLGNPVEIDDNMPDIAADALPDCIWRLQKGLPDRRSCGRPPVASRSVHGKALRQILPDQKNIWRRH